MVIADKQRVPVQPLAALVVLALAAALPAADPDYARDVAPLLEKRCGGCHAGEARLGDFQHNTYAEFMKGGNQGSPVIPGKPDESLLILMVTGKGSSPMPMDGTHLSDADVNLLRAWILAGAKAPSKETAPPPKAATPVLAPRGPAPQQAYAAAWQPGGLLVAIAGHREVRLLPARAKHPVATLTGHAGPVRNVAFSRDGKLLAAAGGVCAKSGEVKIWDVDSRSERLTINGHSDCIYGLAFSPDGSMLATSSYDKLIKLWDTATGKELRTLKDHIDAVYAVAFTPDGKLVVSASADRGVKVWNPATGERLYTLSEATDGLNTLAISPSGRQVAAAGLDKSIRVWNISAASGELVHSLMAHEDAIVDLAWLPDGAALISASADRTVKVWRASDLAEMRSLPKQSDWVSGLEFSPDGAQLAIARLDGSVDFVAAAQLTAAR